MREPLLSTMWMQLRHARIADFAVEARALGFRFLEVGHVVTPAMLAALPSGAWGVRVLHHPCPNPGNVPELSDPDEGRRRQAVAAVWETLAWAQRFQAEAVVLHLGLVHDLDRRWEHALRARWVTAHTAGRVAGGQGPEYGALYDEVQRLRALYAPQAVAAAYKSLGKIVPRAADMGVRVGLENGEWLGAIPNLREMKAILAEFPAVGLGGWLDTGHATIVARLGEAAGDDSQALQQWAQVMSPRLVGLHLHDVAGLRDHLIPGLGTVDFEMLRAFVPPDAIRTCEFDWYFTPDEVMIGAQRLAHIGLIQWERPL